MEYRLLHCLSKFDRSVFLFLKPISYFGFYLETIREKAISIFPEPGSVAGPVLQANGRLTFEDDLRSGGLLCFISMNAIVRTELADSMVTPGDPGGD